ncbi:hypothetical protein FC093_08200 [Ilyomonas limi]|uniref:Uncharacterized protein n=1 Tax=Ilyomonas limi TaxID=2575867 RepID=A0A4U3L4M8_9BACT|nr:hypothetical protein [Ilyomonas limi]TKK69289.1 hypothetical protein FC093_08200 [Ilyomonas limi]
MSFLKQLLTPFVEFDEDAKKKEAAKGNTPAAPAAQPAQPAAPATVPPAGENAHHPLIDGESKTPDISNQIPTYSPSGTISKPLPEHQQYFEKLIDDANRTNPFFQGADFKEFVDSKLDIDDIQDEALKYKTAFNILKNSGLTKEKLLSTGQEYLNIIGRDMNAFQSAQALQYNKEVRPKEQLIQQKAEELQQLTLRINALKSEINAFTQDINLAKEKLSTTKNSFLLAGENKQKEIEAELQKVARYF